MSSTPPTGQRASLSTPRIVFLVIAAAAPLASMIGNLPIALGRGNGVGTPGAFVIAGVTLLCFAVGYAAMSRRIVNTGAFYTYITEGLGSAAGIGSAYVALLAYLAFTFGLAAFFGYFTAIVLGEAGLHLPWPLFAAIGIVLVAVLGYRSIDLSSLILGALMIGEIVILATFDGSVIAAKGFATAMPVHALAPGEVFTPGLGVSLMVAFTCFLGFESAALYGEEAVDPKRSIPIATYTAVIAIAVFYLFTAWVTIGAIEPDDIAGRANKETGELMFNVFTRYGGEVLTDIMGVFFFLSLLASYLAIHNAASRYIFALGREWLLPPWAGEADPRSGAPSRASLCVTVLTILTVAPFALGGLDPFKDGVLVVIGFGSFGIIFLQAFAAIAILAYLHRHGGEPLWVMVATWAGMLGLIGATVFVALYFKLLATNDDAFVGVLPFAFPAIVLVCLGLGAVPGLIRPKRPPPQPDPDFTMSNSGESLPKASPEFSVNGDPNGWPGPWAVRHRNPFGRELTSDPKPTFQAAVEHARHLRDRRGADVLEIVPATEPLVGSAV